MDLTVLAQITQLTAWEEFLQLTVRGLALGSIFALIALGFVIIYKATEVINFAHGALMVVGAYIVFTLTSGKFPWPSGDNSVDFPSWLQWWLDIGIGWRFALAIVVSAVLVAGLGLLIERSILRKMVGQPVFAIVLITLGLELAIATGVQVLWGPQQKSLPSPFGFGSVTRIGNVGIQTVNFWVIGVTGVLIILFFAFFRYSRYGVAMRATAFDQEAAMAMGIKASTVFALAWAIGGALAAVAGAFFVPARSAGFLEITPLRFSALQAFPAAVLGGLDSPSGSIVGGLIIGLAQIYAARWLSPWFFEQGFASFEIVFSFLLMIAILLVRPYGLFGTQEVRRV